MAAPAPAGGSISAQEFREAMSRLTTAVSVITTDGPAGRSGLTCSAVCAASDTPPLLVACVHGASNANKALKENGVLCVNCLGADQSDLSQTFAGARGVPMNERFTGDHWDKLITGAPRHREALVALDCEIVNVIEAGTHSVFLARVLATAHNDPADPLIYHRRSYATTRAL